MKKQVILMAIFSLFLAVAAVSAQEKMAATSDFSGNWDLDVSKSKLGDRNRVESMTMNVTQTGKEIKVESNTKRAARPEGDQPSAGGGNGGGGGMRQGGGMGRGGMMGGGSGTVTYSLDGKEITVETESAGNMPAGKTMLKSKMEKDGKLKLMSTRNFDTPNGSISVKTTETWELTDGGKGLKVTRDMETPRGTQTSEMYFTKKS